MMPWSDTISPSPSPRRTPRTLAPNLSRRSHKKSRSGCLNCKARKIKCQETRPSCENCNFRGLECGYPSATQQKVTRRPSCTIKSSSTRGKDADLKLDQLLSPSLSFSMEDLRCFHHFLTVAYPHLPLGNDEVWVRDIPIFAQQYDYLMHAILALGASHLTRVGPVDYSTTAIVHRGKAIKGLNEAIAKGASGYGAADSMLAACYALTFQASYMGDGMTDFVTLIRGCALMTEQIKNSQTQTCFSLETDNQFRLIEARLEELPSPDPTLIPPAILSVEALCPLLRTKMEHSLHSRILSVLFALQESPQAGYLVFIHSHATFHEMGLDQFNMFLDANNMTSQLLMAHFVSLQIMLIPLALHEWDQRPETASASPLMGIVEWGEGILQRVPQTMHKYLAWPKSMMLTVRSELEAIAAGTHQSLELRILRM